MVRSGHTGRRMIMPLAAVPVAGCGSTAGSGPPLLKSQNLDTTISLSSMDTPTSIDKHGTELQITALDGVAHAAVRWR
jgi:hypothetical protein